MERRACEFCAHHRLVRSMLVCTVAGRVRLASQLRQEGYICGPDAYLFDEAPPIPELMASDSEGGEL